VLGKHSGRHALQQALSELGFEVSGQTLNAAFKRFKEIADKKKQVTSMDLEALVTDELRGEIAGYQLEWFDIEASSRRPPHATVGVHTPDGQDAVGSSTGDGPVDAIFHAINTAAGVDARLREFRVDAVTAGQDALGEASVVLEVDGVVGSGQGVSTDILDAAGRAYVRALSNALRRQRAQTDAEADAIPTP
jgi:2-isopropylmalate synthase